MDHVAQQFGEGLFQTHLPHAVVGTVPFTLGLVVIWCLVVFCLSYMRRVRESAIIVPLQFVARFRYNLAASGVRHLIPTGIATAFYVLLSYYIYWFPDHLTFHSLIVMQKYFEGVSEFFSHYLKLNEWQIVVVLVAIYLLSCVLLSRQRPENSEGVAAAGTGDQLRFRKRFVETLYRAVGVYGKYYSPLALLLATLASFTFFGMQLAEPAKDLQLRVTDVQGEYTEVTKRTEAELSQRVAAALYAKIRNTFPSSYQERLKLPTQIDSEVASLQQHADGAKSRGVSDPTVERTLQDEKARIKKVSELKSDLRIEGTGRYSVPGDITYNQIEAAKKELDSRHSEGIEIIREGQKKIVLEVGLLGSGQVMKIVKPLIDVIPVVEPLVATFAEAFDKTFHESIEKFYDHAIETAMYNPRDLEAVVESKAKAIVDETDVHTLVERATPRAEQQSKELEQRLSSLRENKLLIDRNVGIPTLPDPHLPPRDSQGRITSPRQLDPPKAPEKFEISKDPLRKRPGLTHKFHIP